MSKHKNIAPHSIAHAMFRQRLMQFMRRIHSKFEKPGKVFMGQLSHAAN
jgi:hypothetical protein